MFFTIPSLVCGVLVVFSLTYIFSATAVFSYPAFHCWQNLNVRFVVAAGKTWWRVVWSSTSTRWRKKRSCLPCTPPSWRRVLATVPPTPIVRYISLLFTKTQKYRSIYFAINSYLFVDPPKYDSRCVCLHHSLPRSQPIPT